LQIKTFVITSRKHRKILDEPKYEYKPQKYKWLADICWKILHKISAIKTHLYGETYEVFKFTELEQKRLDDFIFKNVKNINDICSMYNPEQLIIYIGQEQFANLMNLDSSKSLYRFDVTTSLRNGYTGRYYSIPVLVVPWLDGLVILPKG
jgi:uncharacterized protein YcgL (UPF0745 family)